MRCQQTSRPPSTPPALQHPKPLPGAQGVATAATRPGGPCPCPHVGFEQPETTAPHLCTPRTWPHILGDPVHVPMWAPSSLRPQPRVHAPQGCGHRNPGDLGAPQSLCCISVHHMPPAQAGDKLRGPAGAGTPRASSARRGRCHSSACGARGRPRFWQRARTRQPQRLLGIFHWEGTLPWACDRGGAPQVPPTPMAGGPAAPWS